MRQVPDALIVKRNLEVQFATKFGPPSRLGGGRSVVHLDGVEVFSSARARAAAEAS